MERRLLVGAARTVLQMLHDRGYDVPDEVKDASDDALYTLFAITGQGRNEFQLHPYKEQLKKKNGHLLLPQRVAWYITDSMGVKQLREIMDDVRRTKDHVPHLLLLSHAPATSSVYTELAKQRHESPSVEIFELHKMYRNLIYHKVQPKFRVLGYEEGQTIVQRFGGNASKLLFMFTTDFVARYFGISECEGVIVECRRRTGTVWRIIKYQPRG